MTIAELLACGGGVVALLLTVVQIIPIKVNPWSAIARWLGKALNADVLKELQEVKQSQAQTNARLDKQVKVEDARNADRERADSSLQRGTDAGRVSHTGGFYRNFVRD